MFIDKQNTFILPNYLGGRPSLRLKITVVARATQTVYLAPPYHFIRSYIFHHVVQIQPYFSRFLELSMEGHR